MKKFLPLVTLLVGCAAGWFFAQLQNYKGPGELGLQQIDSVKLLDLSNRLTAANEEIRKLGGKPAE